jgi:hypothetical protein
VISPFGDVLLAVEHDHVGTLNDSLMLVIDGSKCGYANAGGQWVIAQEFEAPEGVATWGDFHNGFAEAQKGGKRGLIDRSGKKVFDLAFQDVGRVEKGLVPVKKKDKWAYVDRTMRPATQYRYDQAWEPKNGLARVRIGGAFGMIDSTGKELIPLQYEKLSDADASRYMVATANGRTGALSADHATVVPFEYDEVQLMEPAPSSAARLAKLTRNKLLAYYRIDTGQFIWKEAGFEAGQ